ncbi:MAG: transcriptional repressor [Actinobacteria bacterium]|nr:transcriptional repressor [Actinomycetota bacterium]
MLFEPMNTLQAHGMPVTAQRLAVLRAVNSNPHATADHIAAFATKDIGSISKQSVYDTLSTMVERGVLRKIQPVGSVRPCLSASHTHGFIIDEADVSYWGTCVTCAKNRKQTVKQTSSKKSSSKKTNSNKITNKKTPSKKPTTRKGK